jgi:hypothetical protein
MRLSNKQERFQKNIPGQAINKHAITTQINSKADFRECSKNKVEGCFVNK